MGVKCDQCPSTFQNKFNLKQHQLYVHSDLKPFICEFPDCKFRTKTNSSLRLHKRLHETDINLRKPHRCPFVSCAYRATMTSTLRLHFSRKHSSPVTARVKKYQCQLCPSMFCTNQTLSTHIARHTAEGMLACSHCDYKSDRRVRLMHHLQNVHNLLDSTTFACEFNGCNFSTRHRESLQRHQRTHNPVPTVRHLVPCSYSGCNYHAATPYRLKMHNRARHGSSRLQNVACPMCPKHFYHHQGLKSHLTRVHTNEKLQHWDKCKFSAHFPHEMRLHYQRAHVKEKLLKCESCDHSAHRKFDLKFHEMTVHSDQRRFKCDNEGCDYQTNSKANFKEHILRHEKGPEGKFPFACSVPGCGCDFRRRCRKHMKAHERLHETSALDFRCKVCPGKGYPDRNSLHFQMHGTRQEDLQVQHM